MNFLYLKALHIIFIVTWFAGLFYIVRLFIYHVEALELENDIEKNTLHRQFSIMEKRLWYGITIPSSVLTIIFGLSMLHLYFPLTEHPWLIAKLIFVGILLIYQYICSTILKSLKNCNCNWTSSRLRLWNEVATVLLFAIVFLVVLKDMLSAGKGIFYLIFISIILFISILIYKKKRKVSNE